MADASLTPTQLAANTTANNLANYGPVPVTPPTTGSTTISSASMTPTATMTPGTPPTDTTNYPGIISGNAASIGNDFASLDAKQTAAQSALNDPNNPDSLSNQIAALSGEDVNKTNDTATAYQTGGVNDAYNTQQSLNNQIQNLNFASQAIPSENDQYNAGRGTDKAIAQVQTNSALRTNAIAALGVSEQYALASKNYASAKNAADQAINYKYAPIEAHLAALQSQYNMNKDNLDAISAKRSEALKVSLDKQTADAATAKQTASDISAIKLEAAKNGAPAAVLASIDKATDGNDAINLAKGYMSNPLDNELKAAQIKSALATANQKTGLSSDYISSVISTLNSYNGTKYITPTDLTGMSPSDKANFIRAAKTAGIQTLSPKDSDALSSIDAAKQDLSSFQNFILTSGDGGTPVLPKNWLGQPQQIADVKLNDFLQTNNQLSAYNSWKAQVVPLLTALKGAGSGGGGAGRLFATVDTMLPQDTDPLGTAQSKITNINTILDNSANSIIKPSTTSTQSYTAGQTVTQSDGSVYKISADGKSATRIK